MFKKLNVSLPFIFNVFKKIYIEIIILLLLFGGLKFGGFNGLYINSDGKGYYAYLPAVIIYKDYNFSFANNMNEKYYPEGVQGDFRNEINGRKVNKYFIGLSVLWLPFFLLAHILSYILGFPADGYSLLYQHSILIAALFYLWIGLLYLRKLLISFGFSKDTILSITILIVLATPLIFYTIFNPDYSHVYSFTLVTLFLYHVLRFSVSCNPKNLLYFLIFLGLIILVRPVNAMVVLAIPFITGSIQKFLRFLTFLFYHFRFLLVGIVIFSIILFVQLLYYKIESGSWFIWAYSGEKFNFLKPHFSEALISYQKGIFVYTPLLFLSLLGFYGLFKQSRFRATYLLLFLGLVVYILSSWECWGYGMCFGYRPITEYLPFFAFVLGFALQIRMKRVFKIAFYLGLAFTLLYNIVSLHQYKQFILHWDAMNKESYWKVFMRTSPKYHGILWKDNYSITQPRPDLPTDTIYKNTFELNFFSSHNKGYGSASAYELDKKHGNSLIDSVSLSIPEPYDSVSFYVSAYIKPISIIKKNSLKLTLKFAYNTSVIAEKKKRLQILPFKKDQWYYISQVVTINNPPLGGNFFNIELANNGNQKFLVDNLTVERIIFKPE